ncbi:metallophosphoesterase [Actinophytocola algeriensis]|uniref:3',5'-cyclic AMP phosphodiesterase CpdA n=1 Tax=Actinophytocola algeriensis TaxID=1768010 RepID=A0A7W7QAI3_9PSEU|nr:metallophosphoesterase [Actinophytocola algeriensis]MBB4910000.1 3',5'-cyclic AMP phosphodiesterase CpdA [Actinophytocola algeriensis]MBE1475990.1 3',5'-cyclic AMP phosphodiesterase CpdA [Actinophytocola algeriensis]
MAVIAHLSDPHLTTGPLGAAPATALYRALGRVRTLDPPPDRVVITGDLVEHGTPEEYRALHEVIGRFPLPLHLVAGNHDNPEKLLAEFGNTRFLGGTTHYTADTLVVLDSAAGYLGAEQLAWLDRTLATTGPAFVCLHHPPIPVGIPFLDRQRLTDGEQLAAVVERHDVTAVLAGHVHRHVTAAFAGTILVTAPSTHLQSGLAMTGTVPDYLPEPTSFLLHLDGTTHTVPVSHAAGTVACY